MSKILKAAAPSESQKKKWWRSPLECGICAVLAMLASVLFPIIFDAVLGRIAQADEYVMMKNIFSTIFVIAAVSMGILTVLHFLSAPKKANAKIEVTEDGVRGVSCPRISIAPAVSLFNRNFDIKYRDIEKVEFVKSEMAVSISCQNTVHMIRVEEAEEIVELIKKLKYC